MCVPTTLLAAVYIVTVGKYPACTCPDFHSKGNLCKHYLFIMLRVLRLDQSDPLVWQKALLKTEVQRHQRLLSCLAARPSAVSAMHANQGRATFTAMAYVMLLLSDSHVVRFCAFAFNKPILDTHAISSAAKS